MKDMRIEEFGKSSDLHLCNTCDLELPTCPGEIIVWGNGKGNDNVVACLGYKCMVAYDKTEIENYGRQPEIK